MALTSSQLDTITRTVMGEARPNDPQGQAAVAWVIKNRADSGQFPGDPAAVALQPAQFSAWNSPANGGNLVGRNADPNSAAYQQVARVVQGVYGGAIPDPTNGATYYHTPAVHPSWDQSMTQTAALGGHVFYSPHPVPPAGVPTQPNASGSPDERSTNGSWPAAFTPVPLAPAPGHANASGGPDDRSATPFSPPNVTPIPLAPLPSAPNSSGSPDDRGSGGPFSYTTPPPATAPTMNASGSPDDRGSSPVPSLPNPYKPSGGPFSYTTPPPAYAAPNSSGSPDDRSSPTPGVQRTDGGIAGTVQLPSGVRPITVPLSSGGGGGGSSSSSQGGGFYAPPSSNDLPFSYAAPPSSYTPTAPNSSGSPDDRGTTYTTHTVQVANPAYTAWMNNQSPISPFSNPGVQGLSPDDRDSPDGIARAVPGLTSSAFAIPAPPKYITKVIRVPVAAAKPVYLPNGSGGYSQSQSAPAPQQTVSLASGAQANVGQVYSSPNGYTYKVNADGSTTNQQTGITYQQQPAQNSANIGYAAANQPGGGSRNDTFNVD